MTVRQGAYRTNYAGLKHTTAGAANLIVDNVVMDHGGWVTSIGVKAGGDGGHADARLVAYNQAGDTRVALSGLRDWANGDAERTYELPFPGYLLRSSEMLRVGFWVDPTDNALYDYLSVGLHGRFNVGGASAPATVSTSYAADGSLACWLDYVPNQPPNKGKWVNLTPTGQSGNLNPTFQGQLTHPAGEGDRDSTKRIYYRVFDETTGTVAAEGYWTPTASEIALQRFSRQIFTHVIGHTYHAIYRHQDQFGVWGDQSDRTTYTTDPGPVKPVLTAPTGKKDSLRPNISGSYAHNQGIALDAVRFRVYNGAGTTILQTSDWATVTGTTSWTLAGFGTAESLDVARRYQISVQVRDKAEPVGGVSGWSDLIPFYTDSPPNKPNMLSPKDMVRDGVGVLSCHVTDDDPDDEPLEQVKFFVYINGHLKAGWPADGRSGVVSGRRATFNAAPYLTLGEVYTWTCQSYDGFKYSEMSEEEEFYYATEPLLEAIFPDSLTAINGAWPPTAQFSNALSGVALTGSATGKQLAVVDDTTADSDGPVWKINKGGNNATAVFEWNSRYPCSPGQKVFLGVGLKDSPDLNQIGTVIPRIACYNTSGALISTINTDLGTMVVPSSWKFDGALLNAVTPAGTASISPQIQMPAPETGAMFVDSVMVVKVDSDAPLASDFTGYYVPWYGPFKGNTPGIQGVDDYSWAGAAGASASRGVWNLSRPQARFKFRYSHLPGVDVYQKRCVLERYLHGKWIGMYNSGKQLFRDFPQTYFDLPEDKMVNRMRYRIRVHAWDENGAEGDTGWVNFDTDFFGPKEVDLIPAECYGDDKKAQLVLTWEDPVGSEADNYVGVELAVESAEEGEIVHTMIRDPDLRQWVYPWPVSGREYECKVRRVVLKDGQKVGSKWSTIDLSVDYFPRYFLKDVEHPTSWIVSWVPKKGEVPAITSNVPIDEYLPIFIPEDGGPSAGAPLHFLGTNHYRSGSFSTSLEEDRYWSIPEDVQLERAMLIESGHRTCGFLGHIQMPKEFVVLTELGLGVNDLDEPTMDGAWVATRYEEDYLLREVKD